jgi:hypothetical protein
VIIEEELNMNYHMRNPSITEMASSKMSAIRNIDDLSSRVKSPFWDNDNSVSFGEEYELKQRRS